MYIENFLETTKILFTKQHIKYAPVFYANLVKAGFGGKVPIILYEKEQITQSEVLVGEQCSSRLRICYNQSINDSRLKPKLLAPADTKDIRNIIFNYPVLLTRDKAFKYFMEEVKALSGQLLSNEENAKKVLNYIHIFMDESDQSVQVKQAQKNLIKNIQVPEFPEKSVGYKFANALFILTITAFALALACSLTNVKPIRNIITNMSAKDKMSGIGNFFKYISDFAINQLGPKKAAITTVGFGVATLFAAGNRGWQKIGYLSQQDEAYEKFFNKVWGDFFKEIRTKRGY